jgi:hypothetical protein
MSVIVKTEKIGGKTIEVHEDSYGRRRYWAKVDGAALFQRVRTFTTAEGARAAAIEEARS